MRGMRIGTEGLSLFTESFGKSEHPAVLLIMGAMASGVWWPDGFCERLAARGLFVIRYDHRDTGQSTSYGRGLPPYTVEDLADDAIRVLDGYHLKRAHLAGMSLGGYLAQLIALKHGDRVLTLTLIASERLAKADPNIPGIDPKVLQYHARAAELDWSDRHAVIEYQVGAWRLLSGSAHPFDEEAIRSMAATDLDRTPDPLTAFNHAKLQDAEEWSGRLGEIHTPALVIHGTEDIVLPYAHGLALASQLPNARLVTLPGSGHELHREDWPVIVDAMAKHTLGTGA
jgi:pimeloyl-ACP methyl ester carboxylesterase